jgi:hypothetical protein
MKIFSRISRVMPPRLMRGMRGNPSGKLILAMASLNKRLVHGIAGSHVRCGIGAHGANRRPMQR